MAGDCSLSGSDLCARCSTYNFQEWFYPSDEKAAPFGGKIYHLDLDWQTILQNYGSCSFCRIILNTLQLRHNLGNTDAKTERMSGVFLSLKNIGTVSWTPTELDDQETLTLKAPGRRWEGDSYCRTIRYLEVIGSGRVEVTTADLYPTCRTKTNKRDGLLHYLPVPHDHGLDLEKLWLKTCTEFHERQCAPGVWEGMPSGKLRMIDVQEWCVVSIYETVQYFALSYCWGDAFTTRKGIQLTSTTKDGLQRYGALTEIREHLPTTICDAMIVTQELGTRYLWVDAPCIVQDDPYEKMSQINQMDKVYAHADLTIVAASGTNVWSGLSGVHKGSRSSKEFTQVLGDIELTTRLPELQFSGAVLASAWFQRAWTLQEDMLSQRRFFFTQHEMLWGCEMGT